MPHPSVQWDLCLAGCKLCNGCHLSEIIVNNMLLTCCLLRCLSIPHELKCVTGLSTCLVLACREPLHPAHGSWSGFCDLTGCSSWTADEPVPGSLCGSSSPCVAVTPPSGCPKHQQTQCWTCHCWSKNLAVVGGVHVYNTTPSGCPKRKQTQCSTIAEAKT